MEIIIVVLLAIIAISVAPWVFAVAAALVAAYGLLLVIAVAIVVAGLVVCAVWKLAFGLSNRDQVIEIHGSRKACPNCQFEIPESAVMCTHCGAVL